MRRMLKIGKWILLAWGGLFLAGAVALVGMIAYGIGVANRDRIDAASPRDVRFVLNWCNLGDNRIEKVIHSRVSARSLTGDHLDAYAIRINDVTVAELEASTNGFRGGWYRGDQLPTVLDDAVAFVGGWLHEIAWFPPETELRSKEIYVYPWSIDCHGIRPSAAEIIFVRPKDKMVFFFGGKT